MKTCPSCDGVLGKDCFNPVECAQITADLNRFPSGYKEIFDTLKKWIPCYSFVSGRITFKREDGLLIVSEFDNMSFWQSAGQLQDEAIVAAFTENDLPSIPETEGTYGFDALLSSEPAQLGEYDRVEVPAVVMVEHIEYAPISHYSTDTPDLDENEYPF